MGQRTRWNSFLPFSDGQAPESCLSQLQNARQLLHSMSRTAVQGTGDPPIVDEQLLRPGEHRDELRVR